MSIIIDGDSIIKWMKFPQNVSAAFLSSSGERIDIIRTSLQSELIRLGIPVWIPARVADKSSTGFIGGGGRI